jgi:diguanylate cyclase (GGDEF)-like protein
MQKRHRLTAYLAGICAIGFPTAGYAISRVPATELTRRPVTLALMTAVLLVGEMRPIPVARGDEVGDEISISSTVACAMLFLAPLGCVMVSQALALTADEARHRRNWFRLTFNVAQYALALLAMNATFASLTGGHPFQAQLLTPRTLPAALLGAMAFFLVNNGLTGIAVAITAQRPILVQLRSDIRWQLATAGVLLALAPVVSEAVRFSPWTLPLLATPLIAVHRSASLAFTREHEALHDALTGLANRNLLQDRLNAACRELPRRPIAVMLLDVDHFKDVNDTLGHQVGDEVIVAVSERLRTVFRAGDLIARLGGDEFAVLVYDVVGADARELATRVASALGDPLQLTGTRISVTASIGVALAPDHGRSSELLLREADVALYVAKERRGIAAFYEPERDRTSLERVALANDLRDALDGAGGLFTVYQPKCDALTGQVTGVEALVRWAHPDHGVLPPSAFVPLAEHLGLLDRLTHLVLEESLAAARAWLHRGWRLGVAVNLTAPQFDSALPAVLSGLLQRHGVPASLLTLELTETAVMSEAGSGVGVLRKLRDLGVRLSIDDFGTGYSSLVYLRRLKLDELKIDAGFVAGLGRNEDDEAIVRATITLGHHFGLHVVAEGVEDDSCWRSLVALGCDTVQGYHFARPLPRPEIDAWLAARLDCSEPERPAPRLAVVDW